MAWFIDEMELKRQGALELLKGLNGKLPDPYDLQRALERGSDPGSVGSRLWTAIHSYATEVAAQATQRIQELERQLCSLQTERDFWKGIAERNQADTLRQKLDQTQQQLQEKSKLAEKTGQELEALRNTLERECCISRTELARYKQAISEQAQIIADQHQKLERLLGMDTPATDRA
jgi:hypothetical protein